MSDKSFNVKKSTLGIGVALIFVFIVGFYLGGIFGVGGSISEAETTQKIQSLLSQNSPDAAFQLTERVVENGIYKVTGDIVDSQGSEQVTVYTTVDGAFLFPQIIPLEQESQPVQSQPQPTPTVPKSDVPVVELYVMSHCPYGTQAEKGIIPVSELLGDKIDFSIKFVDYAMHGKVEVDEQARQVCIMDEQEDKYFDYLNCFLEDGDSERCLGVAKITTSKLNDCVQRIDAQFKITELLEDESTWVNGRYSQFNVHKEGNAEYGVQGSPTLVVNGQQISSGRSPESFLATICSAFNTQPEECLETLSSVTPSAGFGGGAGADSDASCE